MASSGTARAQMTMTVGSKTAQAGDTVSVPITVTHFTNVGAISLKLSYNPETTEFLGLEGSPSGVTFLKSAKGSVITLVWFDATGKTPIDLGDGELVGMRVVYKGGEAPFTFIEPSCEIANMAVQVQHVDYTNGALTPSAQ